MATATLLTSETGVAASKKELCIAIALHLPGLFGLSATLFKCVLRGLGTLFRGVYQSAFHIHPTPPLS